MFSLDALFCDVDDFCHDFEPQKNKLMCLHDKLLSRQRSIIETINVQLKNISFFYKLSQISMRLSYPTVQSSMAELV